MSVRELTNSEKATFARLYAQVYALLPEDGIIDDSCSLVNEIILLFRPELGRREDSSE